LEDWYAGQAGPDRPRWSARQICSAAGEGGRLAQQAVERTGYYLGLGLSNLVTLFIPDLLVLGGGLMNSFSLFSVQIDAALKAQCGMVPLERMRLAAAPDAEFSLAGAAALWEQRQGPVQFG
jgi:glucokinase